MKTSDRNTTAHPFETTLAVIAAAACLIVTTQIWLSVSAAQRIWPFPALYFIEMSGLAILGAVAVIRRLSNAILWGITGIFVAFGVLGAMTVGLFYLTIGLIFAVISVTADIRARRSMWGHLAVCLLSAAVQSGLVIAAAILF